MKNKATMLAENLAVTANVTAIAANVLKNLDTVTESVISDLDSTVLNERIATSFARAVRKKGLGGNTQ